MANKFDVVVIGAGVSGASIARNLARYKIRVAVIEKEVDASFGTSKANSGIIHAGFHDVPGTLKARLCSRGNREFDILAQELGFEFERRGELVVAFDDEQEQTLQKLYQRGVKNGVPYMELLGKDRTLELEPHLNQDIVGSLYAPTAGIVGPYEYCFALIENAVQNGVELMLDEKVCGIVKEGQENFRIETEKGTVVNSRFVVNAAGLYADEIAALLGVNDFKILPRKGEEYLLDRRVGTLVRRVIFPAPTPTSKGILVIPTVDGPVMVGPTADDIDSKNDYTTTKNGLEHVFATAKRLVPAIRTSDIITSFAGVRPVPSGDDFVIKSSTVKGFINAAGIQSPGLTASPAIGEFVKQILLKSGLRMELRADFCAERKPAIRIRKFIEKRDYESLARAIQANPAYSSLVCRCESVSEAEIINAIRQGHTTMDGIKYSTRAGTGRCQGGFCTCRVMKIIERETGIPLEQITKKGLGSGILGCKTRKGLADD